MADLITPQASSPLLRAAALCVMAMAGVSFLDNFIAPMARDIGLVQFHVTRSILGCAGVALAAKLLGVSLWPKSWRAVMIRSGLISMAMMFYFGALGVMAVEEAFAGLFTAPLWVLIVSSLILGHRIGPWRIGAVAFGFIGAMMVLQPDLRALEPLIALPLLAGMFYAGNALATRELCAQENTLTLLFGFFAGIGGLSLVATAVMGVDGAGEGFLLRGWKWPLMSSWFVIVAQAVGSSCAVFLLTRAYQSAPTSWVSGFEYSSLVFAPLFAFLLYGLSVNALSMAGIALIIVSGGVVTWRESRQ